MKAFSLFLSAAALVAGNAQTSYGIETPAARPALLSAAYLIGGKIGDRAEVDGIARAPFQLLYVVAGPNWLTSDFNLPPERAVERLVTAHVYSSPKGNVGNALVPALIEQAHQRRIRVLLCVQGDERRDFAAVAASDARRACFVRTMAAFVKKYNYDGIDIDWEQNVDCANHVRLMADMRQALNSAAPKGRHYLLTTALQTYRAFSPAQARQLCAAVDWINLMTYDIGGGYWGHSATHNTPLNEIKTIMSNKWSVFPPDKVCIGLASYGYLYRGLVPGQPCAGSLRQKGRSIPYTELPKLLASGWKESFDPAAECSYYFSPDRRSFATIDNPSSIKRKLSWANAARFRGVFWWEYHQDYVPADGKRGPRHLLVDQVSGAVGAGGR